MEDRNIVLASLALGLGLGVCAIFSSVDVLPEKSEESTFVVEIQLGGSGTIFRTDGLNDFSYLSEGK